MHAAMFEYHFCMLSVKIYVCISEHFNLVF